jgi:hypothetical protein
MTDHDHDLDRRVAERLREYELAVPESEMALARQPGHARSGWAAVLAVAGGALAGLVLAVLLLDRTRSPIGDVDASATPSATATPSASATPTPASAATPPPATPTPRPPGETREGWTAMPIGVGGQYASVNGVAEWENGLLAFGRSETERGGIWLSEDGATWTAAEVPDSPPGTAVHVVEIVRSASQYVALGVLGHPEGSGPMGSVLWVSADGRAWSEPASAEPMRNAYLGPLVADGETVIAGGQSVWQSTDGGSTWAEVVQAGAENWAMNDLRVFDGRFVAAGLVGSGFGVPSETAMWSSTDGENWERIALDGDAATSMAPLPDGRLLAIGEGDNALLAWVSPDGVAWEPIAIEGRCCITDLAATPTGVVGVGFGPSPGAVSVSTTDATSWSSEEIPLEINAIVFTERFGLVGGGLDAARIPAVILGPHPYP